MDSDLVRGALRALPYSIAAVLAYHVLIGKSNSLVSNPKAIDSAVGYVSKLSKKEQDELPYPPDAIPGARDVNTPYGSIRAYEWGPEDGEKVLFVHGITTPCVALVAVANRLVEKGYRVILFDLFGRGYSGTPDPDTNPQNAQLFCTQIQYVLSSSPLAWTGPSKFHLIGYSLGGSIAIAFAGYSPEHLESLTLIAPAGLIRRARLATTFRVIRKKLLPTSVLRSMVRKNYGGGGVKQGVHKSANPETTAGEVLTSEVPDEKSVARKVALFPGRPGITIPDAVVWQVNNSEAFVPAFVSSIQYGPIEEEHSRWQTVRQLLENQRLHAQDRTNAALKLRQNKILVVLGKDDDVIVSDDLWADARELLGEDWLEVKWIDAGHDLAAEKPDEISKSILDYFTR